MLVIYKEWPLLYNSSTNYQNIQNIYLSLIPFVVQFFIDSQLAYFTRLFSSNVFINIPFVFTSDIFLFNPCFDNTSAISS